MRESINSNCSLGEFPNTARFKASAAAFGFLDSNSREPPHGDKETGGVEAIEYLIGAAVYVRLVGDAYQSPQPARTWPWGLPPTGKE